MQRPGITERERGGRLQRAVSPSWKNRDAVPQKSDALAVLDARTIARGNVLNTIAVEIAGDNTDGTDIGGELKR
jgi:hypothetical protein